MTDNMDTDNGGRADNDEKIPLVTNALTLETHPAAYMTHKGWGGGGVIQSAIDPLKGCVLQTESRGWGSIFSGVRYGPRVDK